MQRDSASSDVVVQLGNLSEWWRMDVEKIPSLA
jgi:hypothetical protein